MSDQFHLSHLHNQKSEYGDYNYSSVYDMLRCTRKNKQMLVENLKQVHHILFSKIIPKWLHYLPITRNVAITSYMNILHKYRGTPVFR